MLTGIIAKILPSWVMTAWPYVQFYLSNRDLVKRWWALTRDIVAKFKREHPNVAPDLTPDEQDVADALRDSSAGRTPYNPKKVRDWTPQEWQNYWDRASGNGQF